MTTRKKADVTGASIKNSTSVEQSQSVPVVAINLRVNDVKRLQLLRKGVELKYGNLVFEVPITSSALESVDSQNQGKLKEQYFLMDKYVEGFLNGKSVDEVFKAYTEKEEQKSRDREEREAREKKEREDDKIRRENEILSFSKELLSQGMLPQDVEQAAQYARDGAYYISNVVASMQGKLERIISEREEEEAKAKRSKEKAEWINKYGSPELKSRFEAGYNVQRRYISERLEKELPGFMAYKFDGMPEPEYFVRTDPSDEAFKLENQLKANGLSAKVKWAKWGSYMDKDENWYDPHSCEIVVVSDWNGYEVYKVIGG